METKSSLLKMVKNVPSKVELARAIINLTICFRDIKRKEPNKEEEVLKLSDTETSVLAYFMVYGVNLSTKNLIVKSGICKNLANIKTIMVKLKKYELIFKDELNGKVYVDKNLSFELTSTVGLYFKIDVKQI